MEVKVLEVRDRGTFIPVIFIRPVPDCPEQRYLLMRDGYRGDAGESCVIAVRSHPATTAFEPEDWLINGTRTMCVAHQYVAKNWPRLRDGDVVDVQYILGETTAPKTSERVTVPG